MSQVIQQAMNKSINRGAFGASRSYTWVTAGVVAVLVSLTVPVEAQDQPQDQGAEAKPQAPKVKVERSATGQKVFRITEGIVVEGRLQKPNAFYVLQRSSIDYDWETLNQGFLPRILQATGQSPF